MLLSRPPSNWLFFVVWIILMTSLLISALVATVAVIETLLAGPSGPYPGSAPYQVPYTVAFLRNVNAGIHRYLRQGCMWYLENDELIINLRNAAADTQKAIHLQTKEPALRTSNLQRALDRENEQIVLQNVKLQESQKTVIQLRAINEDLAERQVRPLQIALDQSLSELGTLDDEKTVLIKHINHLRSESTSLRLKVDILRSDRDKLTKEKEIMIDRINRAKLEKVQMLDETPRLREQQEASQGSIAEWQARENNLIARDKKLSARERAVESVLDQLRGAYHALPTIVQ